MSEADGYRADALGVYLNEIGKVPLLTAPEEVTLAKAVEAGHALTAQREALVNAGEVPAPFTREERLTVAEGNAAKDRFIRANLRLVVSVARRYPLPSGMELLDLIQEGNLGLEHAVDKFDWRKGFKFSTYSTFWIRQSIGRALDQKASLIRLPVERSQQLRAALRAVSGDPTELGDDDTLLHRLATPTSLDKEVGHDGDDTLSDFIADAAAESPYDAIIQSFGTTALGAALGSLNPRSQQAVIERFGLGTGETRSFREIGEGLGVTAEAARRIVKRAIEELGDVDVLAKEYAMDDD